MTYSFRSSGLLDHEITGWDLPFQQSPVLSREVPFVRVGDGLVAHLKADSIGWEI
jgi:hypothetical protein